tara:strand:- start:56 stop:592 length:537 start_codon:yes stop_codon:yes gene_type:complete
MFNELTNIITRSLKLDKTLYRENKNFGELGIYFALIIMILDGIAGAIAASAVIKTNIILSGITAIMTWYIWALLIFVIGVKIFPEKETKANFKKILIAVGYAHAPGLLRFLGFIPELVMPIIFITQFWIFASLIIATREILNFKSNIKSLGVILIAFLIIAIVSLTFIMGKIDNLPIA